jgi:hypothetical protein
MAFLYNYIGKPEKTKAKVHYILDNFYKNTPDGLIGNEDCGQMSAWYVLSSMGIYAVTPGKAEWIETEPLFENIKVNFEDGKSELLNENSNKSRLGIINTKYNFIKPKLTETIIPVPVIQTESKSFKDKMKVTFASFDKATEYFYSINSSKFEMFTNELVLTETSNIKFYSDNGFGKISDTIFAQFFKKPNNYTIDIKSKYNPQYHAGGPDGLIDGIFGTTNWRKGDWQGYQGQDFEAVIDMQKETIIHSIDATFLQDSRSWILMPTKVEYYVSTDNVNFILVGTVENDINPKEFVKVKAYNFGKLPEWHQGFGGDAFIFIDEITIK